MEQPSETAVRAGAWGLLAGLLGLGASSALFGTTPIAEDGVEQVVVDYDSRQVNTRGLMALIPQQYNVSLIGDVALQ
jgi:hypothetical protein